MSAEDVTLKSQVSAEFSESITESVDILKNVIADLKQRLAATAAARERAEAACGGMRQLLELARDTIDTLAGQQAMPDDFYVEQLGRIKLALVDTDAGKSTADELRRLRAANERFANIARGILAGNEREIDSLLRRDCEEALAMYQPARAERSE